MLEFDFKLNRADFNLTAKATVPSSGIVGLWGESGCGKTTLLRCIAGLETVEGHCLFNGKTWLRKENAQSLKPQARGIAYVFQDNRLFHHLTARNNIEYAFKRRLKSTVRAEAATNNGLSPDDIITLLDIRHLENRFPPQLSGGEQKRVAIARALASQPSLLLLDEPLTGLHQSAKQDCLAALEAINQNINISTVFVSHSFNEMARLAEHLLIMQDGKIIANDKLTALSHLIDSPFNQGTEAASVLDAELYDIDTEYGIATANIGNDISFQIAGYNQSRQEKSALANKKLRLHIPAKDVSISLEKAKHSSILNIVPCKIAEIELRDQTSAIIKLSLGGQYLLAMITRKSLDTLQLKPNMQVFAQLKSISLLENRH